MEETEFRNRMRKYLLRSLPEDELRVIKERSVSDSDYQESVLIAEDDLIDDYFDGLLSDSEVEKFETYYLATPEQRQKLRIAHSVKTYAGTNQWVIPPEAEDVPVQEAQNVPIQKVFKTRKSRRWFTIKRPLTLAPLLAALLLLVIVVVVGVNLWTRVQENREAQRRYALVERELTDANQASTPPVFSVVLPPVTPRTGGAANKFALPEDDGLIEVQMIVVGEKYSKYQASLPLPGISQPVIIKNLNPPGPTGQVALKIPSRLLNRGSYQVQLYGVTANGSTEYVGDYSFQITSAPGR